MAKTTNPPDRHDPAATQAASEICGAFVVDASGNVIASNASARQLWSEDHRSLLGRPLAELFSAGKIDAEPEAALVQWQQLKTETLDRWTTRPARRLDGGCLDVRLRLERASGGAGSYIATVLPATR